YSQTIYDPRTGDAQGRNRTPFPNNIIPADRISGVAQRAISLIPPPNLPGTVNNFFASGTEAMNRSNYDVKVDWNRTQTNRIWGKYSAMDAEVGCQFALGEAGANIPGCTPGTGDTLVQLATLGTTLTMSPTLLMDGVIGWTRLGQSVIGLDFGTNIGSEFLGIPGTNGPDIRQSGFPALNFTQYSSLGNTNGWTPMYRNDQSYTTSVNFNWLKGSHNIRFGYDGVRHHLNHWQPELGQGPRGALTFGGGPTALNAPGAAAPGQFNSFGSFLLGLPTSAGKSVQLIKMTAFEWQHGIYFRDRWQVNQKLTLNLGVRWEYYPLMTRATGGIERYDAATNLIYLGGFGDVPKNAGVTVSKKLFAPRVGLAYRATNDTVIRAGYGITYNPMPLARPLRGFYPLTVGSEFEALNGFSAFRPVEEGIPEICCPDLSTGILEVPTTALVRTPFEGQLKRGYIQSWNFFVEQRTPGDFVVSAGYAGTRTIRQFADLDINAAPPGTGQPGRPLNQAFGRTASTLLWQGWLDTDYHALQTSINRQFKNGFFIKGAYTFSKAMNYTDDDGWAGLPLTNYQPALERNRALAGFDRTHVFQMSFVYELPFGQGKPMAQDGAAAALLGGWQLNSNVSAYSGTPFNVVAPGSSLNAPGSTQTADQVKPQVEKLGGIGLGTPFYDPTAFAAPTDPGRFGTTGRNLLRGPMAAGIDLSLYRTFTITERVNLQFRAEAFNATNTPIFSNPANDVGVSSN
ncbi:MAG: TonB-dependent receptor domain-containing protein, partial [Bryobacteraceae bacterium]